jgi:5-methylcytosine-specific restriction endonuclease McrA
MGYQSGVKVSQHLLESKVLILNRTYLAIHVTTVRRGFALLYEGDAKVVDEQYRTFDFQAWRSLEPGVQHESIGLVRGRMRIPRVMLLLNYDRIPKRKVRFSRYTVYARDLNTCQYCGKKLPREKLNLDHVIPRSRGGISAWDNVVCSCHQCNRRKGGRTPEEASMHLIRAPSMPHWTPFNSEAFNLRRYYSWIPFLANTDFWSGEI